MSTDILLAPSVTILNTNSVLVESTPAPHTHNLNDAELLSYFRSGAFTIEQALNPLIGAAAPLFALATKVGLLTNQQTPQSLESRITHEMYSFECLARHQNFRTQTILAARYGICVLLDELIYQSPWGQAHEWPSNRLLHLFYSSVAESDQFYSILERASSDPGQHQELLEFYYFCLSYGFYGKYPHTPEGQLLRQKLVDQLYQTLRRCRSEVSRSLGINAGQKILGTEHKKRLQHPFTLIATVGLVLVTLAVTYSYINLKRTSSTLTKAINNIVMTQPGP